MRIHHVALRTARVPELERFYTGVFGLKVVRRDDARGSVWLDLDGAVLMIERAEPGEPAIPAGAKELVAFAVDDVQAWRGRIPARAPALAIEAETAHTLYFRDPDGRRVAVSDYPLPAGAPDPGAA